MRFWGSSRPILFSPVAATLLTFTVNMGFSFLNYSGATGEGMGLGMLKQHKTHGSDWESPLFFPSLFHQYQHSLYCCKFISRVLKMLVAIFASFLIDFFFLRREFLEVFKLPFALKSFTTSILFWMSSSHSPWLIILRCLQESQFSVNCVSERLLMHLGAQLGHKHEIQLQNRASL